MSSVFRIPFAMPLCVALLFGVASWETLGQDGGSESQSTEATPPTTQPSTQPAQRPISSKNLRPSTQPSTTTQEARNRALERMRRLQELRERAAEQTPPQRPGEPAAGRDLSVEQRRQRAIEQRAELLERARASTQQATTQAAPPTSGPFERTPSGAEGMPSSRVVIDDPNTVPGDDETPVLDDVPATPPGDPTQTPRPGDDEARPGAPTGEARAVLTDAERAARRRERSARRAATRGQTPTRTTTPTARPGTRRTVTPATDQPDRSGVSGDPRMQFTDPSLDDVPPTSQPSVRSDDEPDVAPPPVPDDGRTEWFSFDEMPWEDVVRIIAERIGKPLFGEDYLPVGTLTYKTTRRFTKEEALDELNYLLLEQDKVIVEREDYIYLVPDSELSKVIDLKMVYPSYEAFAAANLRDMQICAVLMKVKGRAAEEVRDMLEPSMPDRSTVVVVGDTNTIKITGLATDVRRFKALIDLIDTERFDPRTTEFITIETNVTQIEQMVRDYFDISAPQRRYNARTREWETTGGESDIKLIPDERTKTLIVKADEAEMKEIQEFIEKVDAKPDLGEFKTTVIPIENGDATEIAQLLNDIFQQEQGEQQRPTFRAPTRTTRDPRTNRIVRTPQAQNQQADPEDIIVEDIYERAKKTIRIVADQRTNNLIVYANDDGLNRVKEMLEKIDQPIPSNFQTFELTFADAAEIQPIVDQFARGLAGGATRGRAARGATVIADEAMNVLHVLAEREPMERIAEIIAQLDTERDEEQQHIVQLINLTPSRVAQMLSGMLSDSRAPTVSRSRGGRTPRAAATQKLIPLDEARILIVNCTDEQWEDEKIGETIKLWDDSAISDQSVQRFFTINNGDPDSIASLLTQLYRTYTHPVLGRTSVLVAVDGKQVVVQGVQPAIEEIEALIPSLDILPEENPLIIVPLANADAEVVAQLAQTLLPEGARAVRGRRGGGGGSTASVQAEPVTNSLLIQADELTTQRVIDFAKDMDTKVAESKPERQFYTLKNAAAREVVAAISSLFGATTSRGRGSRAVGDQVKAVIVGNQVVVDAPESKQREIASLVEQLDAEADQGISTVLVKMPGAQVNSIAQRLSRAFQDRVRNQGVIATFEPDTSTETILMTLSKDVREEAEGLLSEYKELTAGLIWETEFYQLKYANATESARWLRDQIIAMVTQQVGSPAARQVKVEGDDRTNRLTMYAPSVVVKQGLLLLEQYDQETLQQPEPPIEVWTVALPGLDVRGLASQIKPAVDNLCGNRPDRLRATVNADQLTNTLIVSAPKDIREQVEKIIADFSAQTPELTQVQKIIDIQYSDAAYIANQVSSILNVRVARQRGSSVAQQVTLSPDARLNKIIINAPQFAIEMAEALIAELDQKPTTEGQLRTIELVNADANTMLGILNTIFREQVRARTLQISVEPLTNSLIVGGNKENFEEIEKWATELDAKSVDRVADPEIIELQSANPWEVYNVLNATYVQKGAGRRQQPGQEIKISIVAGRSIVVQAPPDKLAEIKALAEKLDQIGVNETVMRTYTLPGMGAELNDFARQIERAANANIPAREQRVSVQALPQSDALVVAATERQFTAVEAAMEQFRDLYKPAKIATLRLENADANMVYQALNRVLQAKIRAGKVQLSAETFTNAIVVSAAEEDMAEIRELATQFDDAALDSTRVTEFFELAFVDAPQIVSAVQQAVAAKLGVRQGTRNAAMNDFTVTADARTNRLMVSAPEKIMPEVRKVIEQLDIEVPDANVVTITLEYADPSETRNMINDIFGTRTSRRGESSAEQVYVTVNNNTLVVKAPPRKLESIKELLANIDKQSDDDLKIKMYDLNVLDAQQVAFQVQMFLRSMSKVQKRGQMQPGAFAEPTTNSLVVIAPPDQLPMIDTLISGIESKQLPTSEAKQYKLTNVRAEQIARNIETMLKAKVAEREGARAKTVQTAVLAEPESNTLIVFAPTDYHELTDELIRMVDTETESGEIVQIVPLEQADATQLAQTANALVQSSSRGRGAPAKVTVVADAGSNSIVLKGLPKDVAELELQVRALAADSTQIPELKIFALKYASSYDVVDTVNTLFPISRNPADTVTVSEDEYGNRIFVTANKRKMRQIEAYIELLDQAPEVNEQGLPIGKEMQFVDIYRGDAYDIAWEVSDLYPSPPQGPTIEADFFGEYIKVVCREGEFDGILKNIRMFEARAKPEYKIKETKITGDLARVLGPLMLQYPDLKVEYSDLEPGQTDSLVTVLRPEGDEPPGVRRKKEPEKTEEGEQGALGPQRDADAKLASARGAASSQRPAMADELAARVAEYLRGTYAFGAAGDDELASGPREEDKVSVRVFPDGRVVMRGPKDKVEDLEDTIDVLESDLGIGEVIRIFKFTYGDVAAAARVLDLMFNEQQRVVRLPQQQQPPQQQRGQRGQGGQNGDERGGQQQPGGDMVSQIRAMMGAQQAGGQQEQPTRLRIATDLGNNYLIVKCDEAKLPEIRQLLRELDIPPGEVEVKVFQLKNIDAVETAENIKGVLGINAAEQRRGASRGAAANRNPQQQLMEILQQQAIAAPGGESATKIDSVEIVSNRVTNSLLVSAPPDVMEIVENVINDLETLEGGSITVIRQYPLEHAKVDDVLPLLTEIFSSAASGGRGGARASASPADLGPVSISGDPRVNAIIYSAQQKDVKIVEDQIERLDIEGALAEVELYACEYGDATSIAAAVAQAFAIGGGQRGGGGRQGGGASSSELRISAEPGTNTVLIFGSAEQRDMVFDKVRDLDRRSANAIREIEVVNAKPEKLAETLLSIFGGTGGGASSGRGAARGGGRSAVAGTPGRIVIFGDEAAGKLLVRAPDNIFKEMEELVVTLDQPSKMLQIRVFPLRYADATGAVESLKTSMMEYIQLSRTTGGEMDFDAFTAVPDARTNSIVVVGSNETFAFVQQIVEAIDRDTPEGQERLARVFVLDYSDAEFVADAINSFAAGDTSVSGGGGGRNRPRGSTAGASKVVDVQAVANPASGAVLVFGRQEDIDLVATAVIDPLEGAISDHLLFDTIALKDATPSQVISFIQPYLDQYAGSAQQTGRNNRGSAQGVATTGPRLIPNDQRKEILVHGSPKQIEQVRALVERFDDADVVENRIKIIPIPLGQDAFNVAATVESTINQSEQINADRSQRQPRFITVAADAFTNSIIVGGDESMFGLAETVVTQLSEIRRPNVVTRVVELNNLTSSEAQQLIERMQQQRTNSTSGLRTSSPRSSTPTRSTIIRPSSNTRTTPQRRPSSGGRRGGGGAFFWRAPRSDREQFDAARPSPHQAGGGPVVAAAPHLGLLSTVLLFQQAADPPAAEESLPPLTSITGQLQGEVVSAPIDSRRIVITGDEEDVAFIEQMLALMELSTPQGILEVFELQNAKATALQPIIEQAVQAYVETNTDGTARADRFSIIAEARSNSLIVSASEQNMEMIRQIINKFDAATETGETQFRLFPLKHIRAEEASTMIQPVIEKLNRFNEVPTEQQASVSAEKRSNSLIVVGTAADLDEIGRLIESIDQELPPEDDFSTSRLVVIDLHNALADDLAEVLNELIDAERTSGTGANAQTPLVRRLLMTTSDGRELPPLDLDKPIRILPVPSKNSLIVFSSEKNNEALTDIVQLFDQLPSSEDIELKAMRLQYAPAEQVAELIQQIFDEGKQALNRPAEGDDPRKTGSMPPLPATNTGRGLPYNVLVSHDVRSNTIFVVGRSDAVLLAASLVSELDHPSADLQIRPRLVQLRTIQATQLKEDLDELLTERLAALGADANKARDGAIIIADDRSNALIVTATDEMFEIVSDLAQELDQAESYRVVDTVYRRMNFADATKLAATLQELFDRKEEANTKTETQTKDTLHVLSDSRSNALLLTGTRDYLTEAAELLDRLDQQYDPTVIFKVRPIVLNRAGNIAASLQEMIDKSRQQEAAEGTPVTIAADEYSNSLLIAASAEDMLMVDRWVDLLDRPNEFGRVTRVIPLRRSDAEALAQQAQDLFGAVGEGGASDVTVTHDATTNSIVAIGPPVVIKDVTDFVRQVESVGPEANAIVRIFKLAQADADTVGEILRSILEGRGGSVGGTGGGGSSGSQTDAARQVMLLYEEQHPDKGRELLRAMRSEIRVLDSISTNSLIVTAPHESMPMLASLITALDVPPDAIKIRVFPLRNADAQEMVTMLTEVFDQQQSGTGGAGGSTEGRELVLGEGGAAGRQTITFSTDPRTNAVIAAGTDSYLAQVEELVTQLDTTEMQIRTTYVYEPLYGEAVPLAQNITDFSDQQKSILDELRNEMSPSARLAQEIIAVASEEKNRVILSYDPRRESDVLNLLRDLDQPPAQVMIQVLILEVTMDNSFELGVEFAFQDLQYTKAGPTDTTTFDFVGGTDIGAAGSGLGGFTFTISGADFNFLIRALQNEGDLQVLSRPQILAMDNLEARIEITNDVPYVTGTSTSIAGQIQTSVARQDVGIILEVTPHINLDGYVRMHVRQEVSDLTGSTIDVGQGVTAPIFFRREAETDVTVKDAETAVLGGLITTRDETREQKIPVLGDIPVLGLLFRNENLTSSRTELLVILTPRVVRTVDDLRELSAQERDRTGELPDEVLTSALMEKLRVSPEDLVPIAGADMTGPFPPTPAAAPTHDQDIYGPPRPTQSIQPAGDPQNTYDIPVSRAAGASQTMQRSQNQ